MAASNPTDVFAMDDLRTIIGRNFITVVGTRSQISAYIDKVFNRAATPAMAMEASLGSSTTTRRDRRRHPIVIETAPIVRYVNLLILQSLNERASDIHVEPTATTCASGTGSTACSTTCRPRPKTIAAAVTTRLKVMADMNIAEHRVPQDGRISLNVGAKGIDLRMATLPTIYGEKVVMRVLDKSNVVLGFEDLGFDEDMLDIYEDLYTKPYGTILVTGPTGSGKTTTLYATLTALNTPEKNIITVEDPVELPLKGINQVQLNVKAGLTFASALRSILRSDPDIVLVGEIRDRETALDRHRSRPHRPHGARHPPHQQRCGHADAPDRDGHRALPRHVCTVRRRRPAARPAAVHALQGALRAHRGGHRMPPAGRIDEVYAGGGLHEVVPGGRVLRLLEQTGYRGRKALLELMAITEEVERMIIEGGQWTTSTGSRQPGHGHFASERTAKGPRG